ncbi:amidohydrolase family protein [Luedemannella flava]
MITVIEGGAIATVDAAGTEYTEGHVVLDGDRIVAVGPGPCRRGGRRHAGGRDRVPGHARPGQHPPPPVPVGDPRLRHGIGPVRLADRAVPGLGGHRRRPDPGHHGGRPGLAGPVGLHDEQRPPLRLPARRGDLVEAQVDAAGSVGIRLHVCRGSMDLGVAAGGLPPDSLVETTDGALAGTAAAIERFHDPAPTAMIKVAVAPCSPFSVTPTLMRESAALARHTGVRLHTHLAETVDEEEFCRKNHNCHPVEYAEQLGWLGDDVWLAHGVHLDSASVGRLGATGTGVAHCPSSNARLGAGTAPVRQLLDAGAPVGLGVDGPASQEAGRLGDELRQALYAARLRGGPAALDARAALSLATIGGARCLGREAELGLLEAGKLADVAVWRLGGLANAGIVDPVTALVFGVLPPLALLLVGGSPVVRDGALVTADEAVLARELGRVAARLRG